MATLIFVNNPDEIVLTPTMPEQFPQFDTPAVSPNDPPWGSLAAFGGWAISVILIIVLPGMVLLPYLLTLDPPITDNKAIVEFAQTDKTAIFLQVLAIIPAHILTLLFAWLVVTKGRKYSFRETLGWDSGRVRWWHYAGILAGFMVVAAVVGHFVPEQENDLIRILRSSRATVYLVVFMATFTAPIVEEVIYRGLLYSAVQRAAGVPIAFLVVTLLFALVHVPQYYPSYSTIFLLTLLSVLLTGLRVWSKNLWPCIVLHMIFNGLQSLLILIETDPASSPPVDPSGIFFWIVK
ncbi:MAG: CPBP family intramembrane metalloprotease [Pyrinomonadaceae bacterium]|nr:CPBP family intramembrane metalloprotease [Pyrinomonadaceae bacterium]